MQDGQENDIKALCQEIRNEQLLETEIASLIEKWEKDHSYVQQSFFACGACGVHQMESPRVVYRPLMLSNPEAEPLCYNEQEIKEFLALVQSTKNDQIPLSEYQSGSFEISKVKSVFSADRGFNNLFHLHPELVSETDNGLQTMICPNCQKHLSKCNHPPMSISAGVDFGDFTRLLLKPPNLHEQILLSRYQLFVVVVKVSSNRQGQISLDSRSAVKQHAVMFRHDSPEKVIDLFSGGRMFDIEQMKESIQIWLLGPCHELDSLAHKVFRTCNLLAWPWVLFQWLQIQFYADLEIPSLDVLTVHLQVVHQYLEQMEVTVSDPTLIQSEVGVGSDVAQAQLTEAVP